MSSSEVARVVESFGRRIIAQLETGERRPASVFGKRLEVVCGDMVRLREPTTAGEWQAVEVQTRRTTFARTDSRGRTEILAANLTLLAVVFAPEPEPDLFIVDRYLAGAAYAGLKPLVIFNKSDLAKPDDEHLLDYERAGYRTLRICARSSDEMSELRRAVAGEIFLLAGQSGVGKSTITNELLAKSARATRELSTASGEGRHTTVSAAWFDLDAKTALIDSPGVRDYAPTPLTDAKVQVGWPEILRRAEDCRFNDCLHLREPGCAVLAAVTDGAISARRYESYKRLLNLMRQLLPSHERF